MNCNEFKETFNVRLNDQQMAALSNTGGQTLLLAVPGSGKTTTLVYRIGYMIFVEGIEPKSILVLTFTTSAARDMEKRFASIFGDEYAGEVKFCTINSICYQIIRRYHRYLYGTDPSVLDDNYGMLIRVCREVAPKTFFTESDIKDLQLQITRAKNLLLTDEEIKKIFTDEGPLFPFYQAYMEQLKKGNLIDFDDQLVIAYKILSENPDILDRIQERYRYVLVDEAQDTSKVQHMTINLIAGRYKQIFMVGDEDQSIYTFRAAYPEALLQFGSIYPEAQILKLEQNYRSATKIVDMASRCIKNNTARYEKNMVPVRKEEGYADSFVCQKRDDQYDLLIRKILPGLDGKTAVLYRNNESAIPLMLKLMDDNIPFQCRGLDDTFFSSKPVIGLINVLKSVMYPTDPELFMCTYSLFSTRLRKKQAENAVKRNRLSGERRLPLWDEVRFDAEDWQLHDVRRVAIGFEQLKGCHDIGEIIQTICDCGYKYAKDDKTFIFKAIAQRYTSIQDLLDDLPEVKYKLMKCANKSAALVLSTIHSSKGLEYDNVIILDAIKGIFPSNHEDVEDERRLFYVGLTRAKNRLMIMQYDGEKQPLLQELKRIPDDEAEESVVIYHDLKKPIEGPELAKALKDYAEGVAVRHKIFGYGVITGKDGTKAQVSFLELDKEKTIDLTFAVGHKVIEIAD